MALPRDYDANPGRFRLGVRVTDRYLTGAEGIYAHIAGMLGRAGAHLIADIGCGEGVLTAAARTPQLQVVGIDTSPPCWRPARARGSRPTHDGSPSHPGPSTQRSR
jgi:2-polyprenyl-3-methyl-5-hydroxy-6-metoxy-1,4-benzoquinol methylase